MNLPFRKKKPAQAPAMPPEVQQYYKAERREQTGIAWLLAIATLLITIAIIVGLFFGGRWIYRKITNRNTTSTTQTETNKSNDNAGNSSNQNQSGNTSGQSGSQSSGSGSNGQSGSSATNNSGNSSSTTPKPATGSTTPPTAQGGVVTPQAATTSMPNTGPGDTVALFFAVTLAGYLLHRYVLATKK